MEGTQAALPRVGELARRDVPRCSLSDKVGDVKHQIEASGWNICVVVNEESVVLGLLREQQLAADPNAAAGEVMRPGPATYRPDVPVADAVERMRKRGVQGVVITTPDGRLIGLLRLEDAERAAPQSETGHGE